jgi:cold shock CspA family protein
MPLDDRERGEIVRWLPARGFGFVRADRTDLIRDLFAPASELPPGARDDTDLIGRRVIFERTPDRQGRGDRAHRIEFEGEDLNG